MSQQKSKNNLINWELVTINPTNKNWSWADLFCYWGITIQSVIGLILIIVFPQIALWLPTLLYGQ